MRLLWRFDNREAPPQPSPTRVAAPRLTPYMRIARSAIPTIQRSQCSGLITCDVFLFSSCDTFVSAAAAKRRCRETERRHRPSMLEGVCRLDVSTSASGFCRSRRFRVPAEGLDHSAFAAAILSRSACFIESNSGVPMGLSFQSIKVCWRSMKNLRVSSFSANPYSARSAFSTMPNMIF